MTEIPRASASTDHLFKPWRRKLCVWFYTGFLLSFTGLLLFTNHYFYAGDAVVRCKLWQYYMLSIQRAFTTTGTLGPTAGTGVEALMTFLTHIVISSLGGLALLAIVAAVRRVHGGGRAASKLDASAD